MAQQGSLELLNDPVAKALLGSANPARLAYTWMDGSPRVVPIWFHWTGDQLVLGSPPKAPKLRVLAADPGRRSRSMAMSGRIRSCSSADERVWRCLMT